MKKLGKCYLDEIVLNDSILYDSANPAKWEEPYPWLTDKLCDSVIKEFPNTGPMSIEIDRSDIKHLLSHFYGRQLAFKQTYLSGDHNARAVVIRKECKKIYGFYIRNSTDKLLQKRDLIQDRLKETSPMTQKFLGFLSTMAFGMDRPKPHKIAKGVGRDEDFLGLGEILEAAIFVCDQNIKPGGGGKPIYKQMTLATAELYTIVTGKRPTRLFTHHGESSSSSGAIPENYPLLNIVRLMASIIEGNLPFNLRGEHQPDLQKACRQMIGRIREENEAK